MKLTLLFPALTAFALTTACATTALPPEHLASSEAAIRSADEVGAANSPQAALHVRLAQEELAQAKQLAKDGDSERAELMLQRSSADAELALALARESDAQFDAHRATVALATVAAAK